VFAEQLRGRVSPIDYDEIERRLGRALEERLGGGYTAQERRVLYEALESFLWLLDNGELELPPGYMTIDQIRTLAQKVAPDEGLEIVEERDAESTTAQAESSDTPGGEYAPDDGIEADTSGTVSRTTSAPLDPAPEFVDPDLGPDEGGEDDPDRDS